MRRIYVASSWRNPTQPEIVSRLMFEGHSVYDFRKDRGVCGVPEPHVFAWTEISEDWKDWSNREYLEALETPPAKDGFACDLAGMEWADTCVLALPCGRSAHIEAGWFAGNGRELFVLISEPPMEPELMYLLADGIFCRIEGLVDRLREPKGVCP